MKKILSLSCLWAFLLLQTPVIALVPGPILLSEESLQSLKNSGDAPLEIPKSRAKGHCLKIESSRICPGIPFVKAQALHSSLLPENASRVLLYPEKGNLQALLVFLPTSFQLPAPSPEQEPLVLGPEPSPLKDVLAVFSEVPSPLPFAQIFPAKIGNVEDLTVWYFAEKHLGLISHHSEKGDFVVGVFVHH